MKKYIRIIVLLCCLTGTAPIHKADAQVAVLGIIRAGVKKAIKAIDLKIQRLQNETIWLQNAQKTIENTLSKLKLEEISDWTEKQKEQYRQYYEELAKVKSVIFYYQRIREITEKQVRLVQEYNRAWNLLQQDEHFTPEEILYMGEVYTGILQESISNIDQIALIVESFTTTMSDAQRLEMINEAADRVEENYSALIRFNNQNITLSLQRAKSIEELRHIKQIYGLP